MFPQNLENAHSQLRASVGSKNDYLPKTLDEARSNFIQRAQATADLLKAGAVRAYHPAPMAKQQRKTQLYCVKIGYGGNNAYVANTVHKASQVLKYESAEDAAAALETFIVPMAEQGAFDEGLQQTLEAHQARAKARHVGRSNPSSKSAE